MKNAPASPGFPMRDVWNRGSALKFTQSPANVACIRCVRAHLKVTLKGSLRVAVSACPRGTAVEQSEEPVRSR